MRRLDEVLQPFRKPMVAARQSALAIHPLLNDPTGVVGDYEAVQKKIESVLHRSAVRLGDAPNPTRFSSG